VLSCVYILTYSSASGMLNSVCRIVSFVKRSHENEPGSL